MANSSLFNLSIDGSSKKSALSFEILEGISGDDYLSVSFAAVSGSVPKSLIGKTANFSFEFNGKRDFFNGVIASYSEEQSGTGISRVNLNVQTLRYWLDREKKSAVYCNSDLETIAKKLLNSNVNMSSYYEIDFKIQYNESDLDFLRRLLNDFNLFEYVKHSKGGSNLVISGSGISEEAELNFTRCRLEMKDSGNLFFGYGHSPFRPGTEFCTFDETFIVCSAFHKGSQEAAFGLKDKKDDGYVCQIAAVSKRALHSLPRCKAKPQVPGVIVAKTEGFVGSFPSIDSDGRYIVRMPFDEENEGMASSSPVHLAQNFAGENYGVHFPLRKDTPILIAFENGDIDKPIALGALPSDMHKGPVAGINSYQNILKTSSGINICLDDSTSSANVEIPENISVKAGDSLNMQTGKNISLKAGGNLNAEVSKNVSTKIGDSLNVETGNKITLKAKRKSVISTQNGVELSLNDYLGSLNIKAPNSISINSSDELSIKSKKKNTIETEKGIKIIFDDSTGCLNIEAPANISIKAGGRLILKGKVVEIN